MEHEFDAGALLGRFYPLTEGFRVSLRMARSSDAAPVRELLERRALADGATLSPIDLTLARLVSFDPRGRYVLAATALIDGAERLVGVGSIDLDETGPGDPQPELVVVDPEAPAELEKFLAAALARHAEALARDRAA
jgi:hypothetical protein